MRRVAIVAYGMYATTRYLKRRPLEAPDELGQHPILSTPPASNEIEQRWLSQLAPGLQPAFVSPVSSALIEAARASAGVAILPRYLGDAERALHHVPMPDAPSESLWLTVHRDLRKTPRVRALLDFISSTMKADEALFRGRPA